MPRTFLLGEAKWFPDGSLGEIPDIEADRDAFDIRSYDLQPGDAIFFNFLSVHGAPGFPFAGRRRVLSLRYLSANATHAPRAWRTSPPFDGLDAELPAGSPMDSPLFPIVWPPADAQVNDAPRRVVQAEDRRRHLEQLAAGALPDLSDPDVMRTTWF
jgi:hypothetical protein